MASKRHVRRKSCTGKRRYLSKAHANYHIGVMIRTGRANGRIASYKCKFCGGFHFGHNGVPL